jgi:hypothetical protein
MKFIQLAMAAAVTAAFSAPAFADAPANTASLNEVSSITNTIGVIGTAVVTGRIEVNAESGASADNEQSIQNATSINLGSTNNALIENSAKDLTGNVGLNMAVGSSNAQGNEASLSSLQDAGSVFASAQTFSTQSSDFIATITDVSLNTADLKNSLTGANGNVGANLVAGSGNMQDNQLAVSVRSGAVGGGSLAKATGSNTQSSSLLLNENALTINTASIVDSIGGMGNIGVNVAAGYGNLQHNSLSIASAK